jgi:hypothetical protein
LFFPRTGGETRPRLAGIRLLSEAGPGNRIIPQRLEIIRDARRDLPGDAPFCDGAEMEKAPGMPGLSVFPDVSRIT